MGVRDKLPDILDNKWALLPLLLKTLPVQILDFFSLYESILDN